MGQKRKIIIMDTSILCVWLKVPGKEVAGKNGAFTYEYVANHIKSEVDQGAKLVLPLASLIETGNHIAHCKGDKQPSADNMARMINDVADGKAPWMAVDSQNRLWEGEELKQLANKWNETVISESQSIGDAAIVKVAEAYASQFEVEIFTGDGGLKNYEYKIVGQRPLRRNRD